MCTRISVAALIHDSKELIGKWWSNHTMEGKWWYNHTVGCYSTIRSNYTHRGWPSKNTMWLERSQIQGVHNAWFHLHQVLKEVKPIYGEKTIRTVVASGDWSGEGIGWREQGNFFWNDGKVLHLERDLGHIDGYIAKMLERHIHDLCISIYVYFT